MGALDVYSIGNLYAAQLRSRFDINFNRLEIKESGDEIQLGDCDPKSK